MTAHHQDRTALTVPLDHPAPPHNPEPIPGFGSQTELDLVTLVSVFDVLLDGLLGRLRIVGVQQADPCVIIGGKLVRRIAKHRIVSRAEIGFPRRDVPGPSAVAGGLQGQGRELVRLCVQVFNVEAILAAVGTAGRFGGACALHFIHFASS